MAENKVGRGSPQFPLRLPSDMRERIKRAADRSGRSMNAEILQALENAFPAEPTIDEMAQDILGHLKILRRFRGNATLANIVDELDFLILNLSQSAEGTPEDRLAAEEHVVKHGDFGRFKPPKGDD